ncbi:MAG TPA: MaoC family dehydratase [Candidatus Binatia bacterium]|nr:MaoC family dehydratase [Candidatus Binatia bacterium]
MSSFAHPPEDRYFEDYIPGAVLEFGSITVDEDEVLEFGKRYVPLSYHTDKEAAKQSIYGGVIASGWHTAALMMRLYTENYLSKVANLGSPGGDELRWHRPVFPGDTLSVRATILETRRSESRGDRGIVRTLIQVLNQKRDVVMSMKMVNFVRCRTAQLASPDA